MINHKPYPILTSGKRLGPSFLSRDEVVIFYAILVINIAFLFATRFYPSMDGPAHLYNSNLIKQLVFRNHFISEFFQINSFPVPNWTGHFIMAFFRLFLPGWLSEKLLLILYVAGMAISFRLLIKTLKPENVGLSIFIFPFIYTFLFHVGFYNYSLSFIFLFLTLAYWINHYKANQLSLYLVTGILLLGAYLSNILTFGFLGIILGGTIFLFEAESVPINSKKYFLLCINRIKGLTLASLPSLVLMFLFFQSVSFSGSKEQYTASELLQWINDVRSLIVYSYKGESYITEQFFHILVFLLLLSLVINKNKVRLKNRLFNARQTIVYFSAVLAVILLFVLPDSSSAGMMSDRLSLMFFILLTILVITQPLPAKVQTIVSVLIISLHLVLLTKHSITMGELNHNAVSVNQSAQYIEANKVVLPVNLSDNWLQPHFSNYLGVDKPMVILENYEAEVGWFPVKWNPVSPRIILGGKPLVNGISLPHNKATLVQKQVDYIFFYGNLSKREDNNHKALNDIIAEEFKLEYQSADNYIAIYKRKLEEPAMGRIKEIEEKAILKSSKKSME